ncbi:MAG: barstar family protein [Eubacteriales bacterium]|nr:barstar family protein [Eubacteriales bacterium]
MVRYVVDGSKMVDRETAHDELARALSLPEHYGRNLDALWDCVCTMEADIVLENAAAMRDALGVYGKKIISVFTDAAGRSTRFFFTQL